MSQVVYVIAQDNEGDTNLVAVRSSLTLAKQLVDKMLTDVFDLEQLGRMEWQCKEGVWMAVDREEDRWYFRIQVAGLDA